MSVWPTGDAVVVMLGSGFEPGDLGGFIVQAIAEAERLPPDPEAFARLQAAVARAAEPPEADPVPPLPDLARVVSGRRFVAEPNDVGVTGFHLDFPGGAEAVFTLGLAVERSDEFADRVSPVGLDGVPRVSDTGRLGLPLAAAGRWDGDTFRVDYDDFANNHRYRLTVRFEDDRAVLTLAEPSTGLEVEVAATAAP